MIDAPSVRPGRLVRLGLIVPLEPTTARLAAVCADQAGFDVVWAPDDAAAQALRPVVTRAVVTVLPPVDEPWARRLPVSIGRTAAEAAARVHNGDVGGLGHPKERGIFGTLADGQAAVAQLAADGVVDLRCAVPEVLDLPDVIAQLSAIAVGSRETHFPGAPRTPDPPPPPWATSTGI
jgi:hypothetical protein